MSRRPRNHSAAPTSRPDRLKGPVSLQLAAMLDLLVAKNILQSRTDPRWDDELERMLAKALGQMFNLGQAAAAESTTRVRQLEDRVAEKNRRIAELEGEVKSVHKQLVAFKKGTLR